MNHRTSITHRLARLAVPMLLALVSALLLMLLLGPGGDSPVLFAGDPIEGPTFTPTPSLTPTVTPTDPPTATPTLSPTITSTLTPTVTPTVTPTATPTFTPTLTVALSETVFLPAIQRAPLAFACPTTSDRTFAAVPVVGPPADHPDAQHGDLNLALRGYAPTHADLQLVEINGQTDAGAPRLAGLFADGRVPIFSAGFRVHDWDWGCGEHGCRGDPLTAETVTLLGMAGAPGEALHIPRRADSIYAGDFIALVLYAEPTRLTLGYTREDTVAHGYAVHLEDLCVDPALVALYRHLNQAGRGNLPGLRNGEILGTLGPDPFKVAIRDRGSFMDPRSRKDWWQGAR
ncbi:MAG: hypothetical protein KBG20_10760 [Caldilineaceae bacterium]|nr:hypothetical protein [Caldilineaceae bacterium]MBP8125614.1 hypothetical protein [Caldilineaceae bacterium]MBP9072774.1 hypothetical protein [Caldilineaceae bacterium]